jgi:formylglycine-generating enzyme required for sulfatase activity
MFFRVGREVIAATQGKQRPEISISMYDQYVLVPSPPKPVAMAAPAAAPVASAAVTAPAAPTAAPVTSAAVPPSPTPVLPAPAPARPTAPQQTAVVAPPVTPVVPPSNPCSGAVAVSLSSHCTAPLTEAEERGLKPKDIFRECDKCPEMVMVPAGTFNMGAPKDEENAQFDEVPQHHVALGQAFAAGRFAVTFDEWDACAAAGWCNGYRPDDRGWGRGQRPVVNVSWNDAKNYAAWLSAKTGKTYRLLSEAEREYVTRAGTTTPFWWGSSISTEQANYNGGYTYGNNSRYGKGEFRQRTLPVDSFGPNPWGFYQVHGNVFEWTEDCGHRYNSAPSDGAAWTPVSCCPRVVRGGSWYSNPTNLRAAHRQTRPCTERSNDVGFRVGRALLTPLVEEQATRR